MERSAVTSDRIAPPVGPFSPAIRVGDTVYLSGQVAQDPATGRLIDADVTRQTEQILTNIEAVLQAAGLSVQDVVKVGVFLTDMGDFQAMNAVYARWFKAPYPARTTVAVVALPLGALVEIDLRNAPNAVTRGSWRILNTGPVTSFNSSNCACWTSAPSTIVRNLYIVNRRRSRP